MARRAKIKSMLMPENSSFMIGTKASGTGVSSSMAPGGESFSSVGGKCSKKSSRVTSLGTTTRVSMSDPVASYQLSSGIEVYLFSKYLAHRHPADSFHM